MAVAVAVAVSDHGSFTVWTSSGKRKMRSQRLLQSVRLVWRHQRLLCGGQLSRRVWDVLGPVLRTSFTINACWHCTAAVDRVRSHGRGRSLSCCRVLQRVGVVRDDDSLLWRRMPGSLRGMRSATRPGNKHGDYNTK